MRWVPPPGIDYSDWIDVKKNGDLVTATLRNWATGIDRYAVVEVFYTLSCSPLGGIGQCRPILAPYSP
jgi:hypothetical protein